MTLNIKKMWNFGNPAESESNFRNAMLENASQPWVVWELQTQLARSMGLQRRFEDAKKELDSIQAGIQNLPDSDEKALVGVRWNLEQGRVLNSSGKPAESMRYFEFAMKTAQRIGNDDLAVDAAHMLAIAAPVDKQVEWAEKAIDLACNSEDPEARAWMGSLCNNLGWTFMEKGEKERALEQFKLSRDAFSERGAAEATRVARWSIARAQRDLGFHKEALLELRSQEDHLKSEDREDGFVYEEIAENLLALGEGDSAAYFAKALPLLEAMDWLVQSEADRIERVRELSQS